MKIKMANVNSTGTLHPELGDIFIYLHTGYLQHIIHTLFQVQEMQQWMKRQKSTLSLSLHFLWGVDSEDR